MAEEEILLDLGEIDVEVREEEEASYHTEAASLVQELERIKGIPLHGRMVNWRNPEQRQRAIRRRYVPMKWEWLPHLRSEKAQFVFEKTEDGFISYRGEMVLMVCRREAYEAREAQRQEKARRQSEDVQEGARERAAESLEESLRVEPLPGLSSVERAGVRRDLQKSAGAIRIEGEDKEVA